MTDQEQLARYYIKWLTGEIALKKMEMDNLPRDSERYLQHHACCATLKKCLNAFIRHYRQQIGNAR